MSALNTVIVELLDSLNVPFVSVKPPASIVITDCTSSTFALLTPLLIVIPPPNAVVAAVPVTVFDVAPVKVTLPVPWLNVPLFCRFPAIVIGAFAAVLVNVPLMMRSANVFVPVALVMVSVPPTVVVPVTE